MSSTHVKIFDSKTGWLLEHEINSYARKNNLEIISISLDHDSECCAAAVVFKKIQPVDY